VRPVASVPAVPDVLPVTLPVTLPTKVPVTLPVNVGDAKSALVAMAVAMLLNSVSISVPLTILSGSPEVSASFVAKLVLLV
jgi:hypothetical protein